MTHAATQSRDQTARQRARQAMADELEKARKRENKLAEVFTAMDTLDAARLSLGTALSGLRDLGVPQAELAELSGLSARDVSAAMKAAKTQVEKNTGSSSSNDGGIAAGHHAGTSDHQSDES